MINFNLASFGTQWATRGWLLFDFANSVAAVIGGVYFTKWYVEDLGSGNLNLNIIFFVSAVAIVGLGGHIGKRIDNGDLKGWIFPSVIVSAISIFTLFLLTQFEPSRIVRACIFFAFLFFLFSYQVGRICHNTYLREYVPIEDQEKMSGKGTAANWIGSIAGIVMTVPVVSAFPGHIGREYTFLLAAVAFSILSTVALTLMFGVPQKSANTGHLAPDKTDNIWSVLKAYGWLPVVYFFLFDSMSMVQRNLPPYLTEVVRMSDNFQAGGFLIILLSAAVGGMIAGQYTTFENSKKTISYFSGLLGLAIFLVALGGSVLLWPAFLLAGASYGMLESAIRLNFMKGISPGQAGRHFGLYSAIERSSGVVGPLIWISPFVLISDVSYSYSWSFTLMALMAFCAAAISIWIRD